MTNDRASTRPAVANRTRRERNAAAASPPRCGFTVIELLVVLAILGILATLLAPTFMGARAEAVAISCGSNLHHIGLGFGAYRAQYSVGYLKSSAVYPISTAWPGVPGRMIDDWNLFICPAETTLSLDSSILEFHSQEGWSVPFGPSSCCEVHRGPGPAWGGASDCPPTPAGATDYGFEDIGGPNSTSHGDSDFNDTVVRIVDGSNEASVIAASAAYSNEIWSNGTMLYKIPGHFGRFEPPLVFPLPEGKTNYGYNAKIPGVGSDATIVAMDYPRVIANTPTEDVHGVIFDHPELRLRHKDKVNVLRADGGVWRARINEIDPTTSEIRKLWGIE